MSSDEVRESFDQAPAEIQAMIRACRQGQPIASRAELERLWQTAFDDAPQGGAPMPNDWGGYRVAPHEVEFWQGRPDRLHDRVRYRPDGPDRWMCERLAP